MQLPKEIITNPGINLGNPAYREYLNGAKEDNPFAYTLLLEKILTAERVKNMRGRIGTVSNVVFIPIPPRSDGNNFLPLRIAEFLAHRIGGEVSCCLKLVYSNGKRRSQSFWQRLLNSRKFEVLNPQGLAGKRIYLVDDQFTTGGTIRDAILSLQESNLRVEGVITLGASFCKKLRATDEQRQEFIRNFGPEGINLIRNLTGLQIESLTYSEIAGILKVKTIEKLKEKLTKGGD